MYGTEGKDRLDHEQKARAEVAEEAKIRKKVRIEEMEEKIRQEMFEEC